MKGALLAEALNALTDRKREVILLSYFMEMSDAAIARKMNLVRSTVHEHRTRSLELLKQIMEENKSECKNKSTEEKWLLPFCIGDNAGSGFPTILDVWKSEGWIKPELIEDTNFDQVTLMMKMEKESDDESAEKSAESAEKAADSKK